MFHFLWQFVPFPLPLLLVLQSYGAFAATLVRSEDRQRMQTKPASLKASTESFSRRAASAFQVCRSVDCEWTLKWNCPLQPLGRNGTAADDGAIGYNCCCKSGGWRQAQVTVQGKAKTVVMVRTHNPMPGMLERMKAWADDLQQNMPSTLFVVSIDTTGGFENIVSDLDAIMPHNTLLHTYTWQDVAAAYPRIAEVTADGCIKKGFKGIIEYDMFTGYGFHTEAIALAIDFIQTRISQLQWDSDTKVWVLEDDIFLCGQHPTLTNFLGQYASDNQHDLLTAQMVGRVNPAFCNVGCSSPAFKKRYPVNQTYLSYEFVTRWSTRLLTHINSLLNDGIHSQSEMYGTTVCLNDNFSCSGLRPELIGKASWDVRLNRSEVAKFCNSASGNQNTILNHAAKYF